MKNKTLGIIIAVILLVVGVTAQLSISLDPETKQSIEDNLKVFDKYIDVKVLTITDLNSISIWSIDKKEEK